MLIVGSDDEDGTPDAMNVAYGGILNAARLQINIGVRHKTSDNIKLNQEFTVGIADKANIVAADYVGIVSGLFIRSTTVEATISGYHMCKEGIERQLRPFIMPDVA